MKSQTPFRIIFKFRDDILLSESFLSKYIDNYPDKYLNATSEFFNNSGKKFREVKTEDMPFGESEDKGIITLNKHWIDFIKFIEVLKSKKYKDKGIHVKIKVLFNSILSKKSKTQSDNLFIFSEIQKEILRREIKDYKLKNFYNFFNIQFSIEESKISVKQLVLEVDEILKVFEKFLPHKNGFSFQLLDLAFSKSYVKQTEGNQSYLQDLNIFPSAGNGSTLPVIDSGNPNYGDGVKLVLVEIRGWNLNHPQFANFRASIDSTLDSRLLYPLIDTPSDLLCAADPYISKHGTKVLGVIKSENNDPSNNCMGITPNADCYFSSCNNEFNDGEEIEDHCENAILAAIWNISTNQPLDIGSVILIEFQTSNKKPIETDTTIFYLIELAFQLGIIVIQGAGNTTTITDIKTQFNGFLPFNTRSLIEGDNIRLNWITNETIGLIEGYLTSNSTTSNFIIDNSSTIIPSLIVGACVKNNSIFYIYDCNYDSTMNRIKIYAQGENVLTTTINEIEIFSYDLFGNTSAAAAILTGFVVSIQSLNLRLHSTPILPLKMIQYLFNNSRDSVYLNVTTPTPVGVLPNYQAIKNSITPYSIVDRVKNLAKKLKLDLRGLFRSSPPRVITFLEDIPYF